MSYSPSSLAGLQAFVTSLGLSALMSCAGVPRPAHELPEDDPRLASIESDCRSRYMGTKPAAAHFAIRDCVDRRVAALFEPPPPPLTAEERRDRARAACRMQGKALQVMDCLDRVDHPPPPPPPEPILTPEERTRRARMRCQMAGKPIQVQDCLHRMARE